MSMPTKDEVRRFVLDHGADLCGFVSTARLNEVTPTIYKPSRLWPEAKTAISIGLHLLDGAAAIGTTDCVQNTRWIAWRTCDFLNNLALDLAHFLERRGVTTLALSAGNMADPDLKNGGIFAELSHRHVAAQAGLGIIGKPSICITPQFGPRCYFITVLTTAEYEPDPRLDDWHPCADCDLCVKACPYDAIKPGARTIKKPLCVPNAMPHGGKILRDWIISLMQEKDPKKRIEMLSEPQFTRLHRATVFVVGTFAGCFWCLNACPVGKSAEDRAKATPSTGGQPWRALPAPDPAHKERRR
jgi:epoxyqueuosine reductase QueG